MNQGPYALVGVNILSEMLSYLDETIDTIINEDEGTKDLQDAMNAGDLERAMNFACSLQHIDGISRLDAARWKSLERVARGKFIDYAGGLEEYRFYNETLKRTDLYTVMLQGKQIAENRYIQPEHHFFQKYWFIAGFCAGWKKES